MGFINPPMIARQGDEMTEDQEVRDLLIDALDGLEWVVSTLAKNRTVGARYTIPLEIENRTRVLYDSLKAEMKGC
jgi:tRNA C32,U32 (ribose-2'-O)-methylase TrmJ